MKCLFASLLILFSVATPAQGVQTQEQALTQDAAQYAARYGVTGGDALRRLHAQQASVHATEEIAREFQSRLAGISIEHSPEYRIVVLLTGDEAVPDRTAAGVPILFRTGARATRDQAIAALRKHLIDLRSELPAARGAGYDQRTGEVVLLVTSADAERFGLDAIRTRAEQLSGVPVRVQVNELIEQNMTVDGGRRVEGLNTQTGRRNVCTSGFVVTDGSRSRNRHGSPLPGRTPISTTRRQRAPAFCGAVGAWLPGRADQPQRKRLQPLFYADRGADSLEAV